MPKFVIFMVLTCLGFTGYTETSQGKFDFNKGQKKYLKRILLCTRDVSEKSFLGSDQLKSILRLLKDISPKKSIDELRNTLDLCKDLKKETAKIKLTKEERLKIIHDDLTYQNQEARFVLGFMDPEVTCALSGGETFIGIIGIKLEGLHCRSTSGRHWLEVSSSLEGGLGFAAVVHSGKTLDLAPTKSPLDGQVSYELASKQDDEDDFAFEFTTGRTETTNSGVIAPSFVATRSSATGIIHKVSGNIRGNFKMFPLGTDTDWLLEDFLSFKR